MRQSVGTAGVLAFLLWVCLWPLVNISSGETAPRRLFISERSLPGGEAAPPRFAAAEVARAAALATALCANGASIEDVALRLAAACAAGGLAAEPTAAGVVVCGARARGIAAGFEYLLLSADVDCGGDGGTGAALTLELASLAASAPWATKDIVLVVTAHNSSARAEDGGSGCGGGGGGGGGGADLREPCDDGGAATAGLEAFLRSHDYDGIAEARSAALRRSWASGAALSYLAWRFGGGAWRRAGDNPNTDATIDGSVTQPLLRVHGVLRAALHLRVTAKAGASSRAAGAGGAAAPLAVGVALAAPGSRLPELDYAALAMGAFAREHLPVIVADAAAAAGGGGGGGAAASAVDSRLAAESARWVRWARRSSALAPLLAWLGATGGDAAAYLARLSTAARMLLRLAIGPYAPHAVLAARGVPAATATLGVRGDFFDEVAPAGAAPLAVSAVPCRVLAPCGDEASPLPAAARRRGGASSSSSSLSPPPASTSLAGFGAGAERVLRAMSGADERLHASLPGYLLLSPRHFVGLVEYLLSAACLHVPLAAALLMGWPPRTAALEEAAAYALLLAVAAAKLALCWVAGMPAASEGAPPPMSLAALPAALAAADVATACLAAPALRRWITARAARRHCCIDYVAVDEDKVDGDDCDGGGSGRPLPLPQPAPAPPPLLPAVFFAWLGFGVQQLSLMYLDFPLFLAAALALVPALLLLSGATPARVLAPTAAGTGGGRGAAAAGAATAAILAVLSVAYLVASPLGWELALGVDAGRLALRRALTLTRRHGTLHIPVLLHAQALLCLCASAVFARPPPLG